MDKLFNYYDLIKTQTSLMDNEVLEGPTATHKEDDVDIIYF